MLGRERHGAPDGALVLSKHEAAGNDFVVLLDRDGCWSVSAEVVRAVCDRRRGVGADGFVVGRPGRDGGAVEMTLYNADGSPAEMSGNGVRCLVQAAVGAGMVAEGVVAVETGAGVRVVDYASTGPADATARVEMGVVRLGSDVEPLLPATVARTCDVGNPHLVVLGGEGLDLDALDLDDLGATGASRAGRPVNVEVVRPGAEAGSLRLRVFERGVGETAACGTGSCAAAAVARALGTVGDVVAVDNPGGRLTVWLEPASTPEDEDAEGAGERGGAWRAVLGGPVRHVADVAVDPALLARAANG